MFVVCIFVSFLPIVTVHSTNSTLDPGFVCTQITAFENMKKLPDLHGEPSQYTFGTMVKVCARLSSDAAERERLMEQLFRQACRRGLVSRAALGQFLRNTPSHVNMRVILSEGGTKRNIPHSWHNNVPRRQKPDPTESEWVDGRDY